MSDNKFRAFLDLELEPRVEPDAPAREAGIMPTEAEARAVGLEDTNAFRQAWEPTGFRAGGMVDEPAPITGPQSDRKTYAVGIIIGICGLGFMLGVHRVEGSVFDFKGMSIMFSCVLGGLFTLWNGFLTSHEGRPWETIHGRKWLSMSAMVMLALSNTIQDNESWLAVSNALIGTINAWQLSHMIRRGR